MFKPGRFKGPFPFTLERIKLPGAAHLADALLWAGRIKGLQLHMAHFTVKAPSLLPMQGRIQFTETSVNPLRPLGNVPLGESQAALQQCAIARFMVHGKVGIQHA